MDFPYKVIVFKAHINMNRACASFFSRYKITPKDMSAKCRINVKNSMYKVYETTNHFHQLLYCLIL